MVQKPNKQYHFTVEGETEKWYLEWIKNLINAEGSATYKVSIDAKVEKSPLNYAKTKTIISPIRVTHWCDYESSDPVHVQQFKKTLDELKESSSRRGKQITYLLGYSNLTFELWMVLHKKDCNHITHRDRYLTPINRAFDEKATVVGRFFSECVPSKPLLASW